MDPWALLIHNMVHGCVYVISDILGNVILNNIVKYIYMN